MISSDRDRTSARAAGSAFGTATLLVALERAPAYRALQAHLSHQALHRAACYSDAFSQQLPPDFASAIDAEVIVSDPVDLRREPRIPVG